MKRFFVFVCGMIGLTAMVWFLLTYILISDEKRIERVIEKGRYCIENGSLIPLANLLSKDYQHEHGISRAEVLAGLRDLFQQTRNRRINILHTSIHVMEEKAQAEVTFLITGNAPQASPGLDALFNGKTAGRNQVTISFLREDHAWKIVRTSFRIIRNGSNANGSILSPFTGYASH